MYLFLLDYLPNSSYVLPERAGRSITLVIVREAKGKSSLRVIKNDGRNKQIPYHGILAFKVKEF